MFSLEGWIMENLWEIFFSKWSYEEIVILNNKLSQDNKIVREMIEEKSLLDAVDTSDLDDI